MTPKRWYNSTSVGFGLPPPPLPPPEYFTNFTYSYARPVTNAEIAVNSCVASKKIPEGPSVTPSKKSSKPGPTATNGNRTYRVRRHHQNHYDLTIESQPAPAPPSNPPAAERQTSSLSQGIFGLPDAQDYFSRSEKQSALPPDTDNEESLTDQNPPHPKPRMKTTLPSWKTMLPSYSQHSEDMDGIIQVRPASRSRTRPEQTSNGPQRRSGAAGGGARRRVQSSIAHVKPSSAETIPPESTASLSLDMIEDIVNKLKTQDCDWEDIVQGFHKIQHLSSECPSQIKPILRKIIWSGLIHLSSSRTKISRAACQCFKILYETQRRAMEGEGDKIFHRLLDLCGGPSNKFIQEECKGALLIAVQYTDPLKCILLMEQYGCHHKNHNVREFAAVLLAKIMDIVPLEKLMSKEFAQKIFPMIVAFLREGQLNTRLSGKQCLIKVIGHHEFQTTLRKFVPPENIRHIQEHLNKLQPKTFAQAGQQRGQKSRL